MDSCQITQWCARFIQEQIKPGDLCIDATMGNQIMRKQKTAVSLQEREKPIPELSS